MSKLVSVIVPIYNTEKYLNECVDSLINQTYENLEIILVDDGSTDKSSIICDEYASNDKRVKVVHKPNGGSSSSRKAGMNISEGDYIMTLDSDDWLDLNTIEKCVETIENENADCVLFSYAKELDVRSVPMHIMDSNKVFNKEEAKLQLHRRLFGLMGEELNHPERAENIVSCCMKLYKSEYAKKGIYVDTKVVGSSEDALFNMYALCDINKAVYIDLPMYHYRKTDNTLTSTYRPKLPYQWNTLFKIMKDIIKEKNLDEDYTEALNNRIALSITSIALNEVSSENSFVKQIKIINEYINEKFYVDSVKALNIEYLPLKWKVFILCAKYKFGFGVWAIAKAMLVLKRYITK